jgi:hypothetical protein
MSKRTKLEGRQLLKKALRLKRWEAEDRFVADEEDSLVLARALRRTIEARRKERARLDAILAHGKARKVFEFLVGKGCHAGRLALQLLQAVQPVEPTRTAADMQKRREQLTTLLHALERIDKNWLLLDSVIRDRVHPFAQFRYLDRFEPACKILIAAVKESVNERPMIPRFNPREQQWLGLLAFVFRSTGKYHPAKVAVLADAMLSEALPSHAEITRAYLRKLVFRRDENKRKWGTLPPKLSRKAFQS